jgi:hypothetical protein
MMSPNLSLKLSRLLIFFALLALLGGFAQRSSAASPDPRMYGAWTVVDTPSQENVGLWVYFSPDGNFLMVEPSTRLGFVGSWVVGRVGLLVNIYGNSRWAKLWDADVAFQDNDRMILNVKDSQFAMPQRIVLQRAAF